MKRPSSIIRIFGISERPDFKLSSACLDNRGCTLSLFFTEICREFISITVVTTISQNDFCKQSTTTQWFDSIGQTTAYELLVNLKSGETRHYFRRPTFFYIKYNIRELCFFNIFAVAGFLFCKSLNHCQTHYFSLYFIKYNLTRRRLSHFCKSFSDFDLRLL